MAILDAASTVTPEQLARWRADTPGCLERNHLNNAGSSLTTNAVLEAVQSHLQLEAVRGGYEAEEMAADGIRDAYRAVGALVGSGPENIAIVENATVATAQAMSAIELGKGDRVVTTNADYISNQLMLLSLEQRARIELVRAADLPEGGVDPDSVRELLRDGRCRLVVISWIPTNSGLVQPVAEVARVCAEAGVPCLVDATQAVGQLPIDVQAVPCTFLAATARKFLRGPRGIGFLYVAPDALAQGLLPLFPDMRGARWTAPDRFEPAPDAKRFENWEFAWALVLGFGAAARYAAEAGIARTGHRARLLAARVRERAARIEGVRVLDRGANLGAIVSLAFERMAPVEVSRQLRRRGINTGASLREYAIIDMDAKHADQTLRVSPHYYNTEDEIEELAVAIEEILAGVANRSVGR